ncbi:hypothetical protein ColTof4_14359 [Colletotrichum tofieldiae]|nr:hypothetical protein ColTof3_14770 [Colletotrichum tofieldiae]GKT81936.1 hypothetical protein ColTof4_14359 [Colletotrichum tofieldiae]
MASPTVCPIRPSSPLSRAPATIRLAIARRLIHSPEYVGGPVGLEHLANLAATSRAWRSLVRPLLYAEAVLSDYTVYAAGGGLAHVCWYSDQQRDCLLPKKDGILMSAAFKGQLDLLQRLVDHASFLSLAVGITRDSLLSTEFVVAWRCLSGFHPVPHYGDPYTGGVPRATLLHAAVLGGQGKIIHWLLERGVHVDQPAHVGCFCPLTDPYLSGESWGPLHTGIPVTALHMAVMRGNDRAAKLLMLSGAVWDRPFTFSSGVTALHLMAANNAVEIIEWLASNPEARRVSHNGPFHDWPDDSGRSSFHHACLAKRPSQDNTAASRLVQALMSLGALLETDDYREVARRLAAEAERVHHQVVQGWSLQEADSDRAWASRLRRGEVMIKGLWASRVCPMEYAVARKNYRMATAMAYAVVRLS